MKIYSIYILNKAGGLIYQNDVNPGLSTLTANDYLVLAGTLHGVHAIATRLRPSESSNPGADFSSINSSIMNTGKAQLPNSNRLGLQHIDTDFFSLYVFQTVTGVKFVIVTTPVEPVESGQAAKSGQSAMSKQFATVSEIFKQFYVYYTDYVMKDPFYSLDMPIRSSMFEKKVTALARA